MFLDLAKPLIDKGEISPPEAIRVVSHAVAFIYHYRNAYFSGLTESEMMNLERNMRHFFSSGVAKLILGAPLFSGDDEFFEKARRIADAPTSKSPTSEDVH